MLSGLLVPTKQQTSSTNQNDNEFNARTITEKKKTSLTINNASGNIF